MISGTDGLLVGGDGGAKISDAGSNGFANEDNVDLVLVFGSILWIFSFYNACSHFR